MRERHAGCELNEISVGPLVSLVACALRSLLYSQSGKPLGSRSVYGVTVDMNVIIMMLSGARGCVLVIVDYIDCGVLPEDTSSSQRGCY